MIKVPLKALGKVNDKQILTPELSQLIGLPSLRTPEDKYLYKSLVIVTSKPQPGMIGRAPDTPDFVFCWATSVREAIYKIEMAFSKNPHGPQLLEIINAEPTNITWSQLMDRDLTAEELGLLGGGVGSERGKEN